MNEVNKFLSEISDELWIGFATFFLGYLSHRRETHNNYERRMEAEASSKNKWFEVELEHLYEKQQSIQEYMERAMTRLESEKQALQERIIILEDKIDQLERENYICKVKYEVLMEQHSEEV